MSLTARITCALFVAALAAACAPKREEVVVTQPAPVTTEPTYTGKYGS
ncbi:hypothetical protein [Falsirhodobacter algicola]|nr:hypothetical protein [Falsirhodobacter algicola]